MDPNTPQPGRIPPIQTAVKVPPVQGVTNPNQSGRIPPIQNGVKVPPIQNQAKPGQPGRINASQFANKIPGVGSMQGKISDAKEIAKDPAGALANKAMSVVASGAMKADANHRYKKALSTAHKRERAPVKTVYRLSMAEASLLFAANVAFDIVDYIAGWFILAFGVGEAVVVVIDLIWGILMTCYCRFRLKLPFLAHMPIYISVLAAYGFDNIPFVNAFWWADALYIIHTIRAEDRQTHAQLMQTIEEEKEQQEQEIWMENYQKQQAQDDQDEAAQEREDIQIEESEQLNQETNNQEVEAGRIPSPKSKTLQQNPQWGVTNTQKQEGPGRFETQKPANAYAADRDKLDKMAGGAQNFTKPTNIETKYLPHQKAINQEIPKTQPIQQLVNNKSPSKQQPLMSQMGNQGFNKLPFASQEAKERIIKKVTELDQKQRDNLKESSQDSLENMEKQLEIKKKQLLSEGIDINHGHYTHK